MKNSLSLIRFKPGSLENFRITEGSGECKTGLEIGLFAAHGNGQDWFRDITLGGAGRESQSADFLEELLVAISVFGEPPSGFRQDSNRWRGSNANHLRALCEYFVTSGQVGIEFPIVTSRPVGCDGMFHVTRFNTPAFLEDSTSEWARHLSVIPLHEVVLGKHIILMIRSIS